MGLQKNLTQLSDQHSHFLLMRRREERNLPEVIRHVGDGASTVFPVCRALVRCMGHGCVWVLRVSRWLSPGFSPRVRKILNLRVFEDESGKHWSKSVMDKQYEVLCVSQFTLQCVLKGNKPDFHLAMPTGQAEAFYKGFLEPLYKAERPELIKGGKFSACLEVHIQNDGPVTIELESPAPGAAASDPKQVSPESGAGQSPGIQGHLLALT